MNAQLLALLVFAVLFVIGTATPINLGLLALVAAYIVGVFVAGMEARDVARSLPADLLITLVGVTYLFAVAQANGAIARMIAAATRVVGPRKALLPWLMFLLAAILTGIGALSPAAVAILAPLAMTFARRNGLNPMVMGLLVVHGAQAGGFSPLSVYGGLTRDAVLKGGLPFDALAPFAASLAANTIAALGLYLLLGRRIAAAATDAAPAATDAAPNEPGANTLTTVLTFGALVAVATLTLGLRLEIGFVAIAFALLLALLTLKSQREVLKTLPWSEILLILGVSTYVAVMQKMGAIDYAAEALAGAGPPAVAALVILYICAVVSAFASSTAVLGSLIPLAIPLLQGQSPTAIAAFIGAIAVASTIVDVSPFSTNGALVLASAEESGRQQLYRRLLLYGGLLVLAAPPVLWVVYQLIA